MIFDPVRPNNDSRSKVCGHKNCHWDNPNLYGKDGVQELDKTFLPHSNDEVCRTVLLLEN